VGDGLSPVCFTSLVEKVFKKTAFQELGRAALSKIHEWLKSMIDAMALVM
jgi:hypothetical protein